MQKSSKPAPPKRLRRTSEEARALALQSARRLLLAQGPDAITLQAVAAELGMSHTNLIHHFGSAGGLQTALMTEMVAEVTGTIEQAVLRLRAGQATARDFVDIVFDAFDGGGAGQLAAWIMLSGAGDKLAPIGEVVSNYVQNIERGAEGPIDDVHARVTSATLLVTIAAFGDAVIGDNLRKMVGRERDTVRQIIGTTLAAMLAAAA